MRMKPFLGLDKAIVDGCGLPRQMKREAHGDQRECLWCLVVWSKSPASSDEKCTGGVGDFSLPLIGNRAGGDGKRMPQIQQGGA
jgi:hypothetical protein